MKLQFKTDKELIMGDIIRKADSDGKFVYNISDVTAIKIGDIDGS